jgi:alpha-tubulin suppressor-like RCC1 family protein
MTKRRLLTALAGALLLGAPPAVAAPAGGSAAPLFVSVAAGTHHTCGLTSTRDVLCWGENNHGQLGNGSQVSQVSPVPVRNLHGVLLLAAGGAHTCAQTAEATWCWGQNDHGQLGNGETTDAAAPVRVSGSAAFTALALGVGHSCGLTAVGGVRCWGNNTDGQLGTGNQLDAHAPTPVVNLAGVSAITAGAQHTCALGAGGAVYCWGYGHQGQLGNGKLDATAYPTKVNGLSGVVSRLAAGAFHTCAATATGVSCWGLNRTYQLGHGTTVGNVGLSPVSVLGLKGPVTALTGGSYHTCAVNAQGAAYCWGNNEVGQLGTGTNTNAPTAVAVKGLSGPVGAISAGMFHTCALDGDHRAACWGKGRMGELGNGSGRDSYTPVTVGEAPSTAADRP